MYIDLLPHDICVKTDSGFEIVVPKGSSIPSRKAIEVELQEEDQKSLTVEIYRSSPASDDYVVVSVLLPHHAEAGRIRVPVESGRNRRSLFRRRRDHRHREWRHCSGVYGLLRTRSQRYEVE